jgi:hypothetical protein
MLLLCIRNFESGFRTCDIVFNRGKSIQRVCLFCIFVRNKISVIEIEMFEPVFMASYVINHTLISTISVSPIVYIEVIPFRLRLHIPQD